MNDTTQAVTPHAHDLTPIVDLAGRHGSGPYRTRIAALCRAAAALQPRLPGRREHPGLARACPGGRIPPGVGNADGRQPDAGDARPRLLSPVRDGVQSRRTRRRSVASTRSSASSATWRPRRAGRSRPPRRHRQARAGRRRRSERPVSRLPSRPPRPPGGDPRGRSGARRHDAFRHSGLSPAARRPDARDRPHRADGRPDRAQPQGRRHPRRSATRAGSMRSSSPSARISASTSTSRARDAVRVLDAVTLLRETGTGDRPLLGRRVVVYGGGNTAMDAARTRPAPRRRGGPDRLPSRSRAHARARVRGRRSARRGRQDQVAHHHQGDRRSDADGRTHGAR